jgi:hypothetical protein
MVRSTVRSPQCRFGAQKARVGYPREANGERVGEVREGLDGGGDWTEGGRRQSVLDGPVRICVTLN